MRSLIVVAAVLASLALQPAVESSLGTLPTPPVVGMTGGTGTETEPGARAVENTVEIWKYGITQGGLAAVLLVVLWSYRREYAALLEQRKGELAVVVKLVEKNTEALVAAEATNARLARAVEAHRILPPGVGA